MKKMFVLFLALCLLLMAGSLALAAPDAFGNISKIGGGVSATKTISTYVTPYAEFTWGDFVAPGHLSGAALDSKIGTLSFSAVANCAVDIQLDATPMTSTGENGEVSILATQYAITYDGITENYQPAPIVAASALDQNSDNFVIHYQVADGQYVYSQHAGDYSAKINLTIMAQAY